MESEALCGIKVLVALAKADGEVHPQERVALEDALEGVGAPAPGSALRRLIPGRGRASANDAFAATWALGKATDLYFQKKEEPSFEELRDAFKTEKKEGAAAAKEAADAIAKRKEAFEKSKATLDADYANERLTRADYIDRLIALD